MSQYSEWGKKWWLLWVKEIIFSYLVVHLFPSWLFRGRNQLKSYRGQPLLKRVFPLLTTYLQPVDIWDRIPLYSVVRKNLRTVDISSITYLPCRFILVCEHPLTYILWKGGGGLNFVKHLWMIPYCWNICTNEIIGLKNINVLDVQENKHRYGMKIGHK